jgi:hypothetical protein
VLRFITYIGGSFAVNATKAVYKFGGFVDTLGTQLNRVESFHCSQLAKIRILDPSLVTRERDARAGDTRCVFYCLTLNRGTTRSMNI